MILRTEKKGQTRKVDSKLLQKILGKPPGPVKNSNCIRITHSCFRLPDLCLLTFSKADLKNRYYLGVAAAARCSFQ